MKISAQEQRTLAALVVSGGIILYTFFMLTGGLRKQVGQLRDQVKSAKDQLKLLEVVTANEAGLRAQEKELQKSVEELRGLLPGEDEEDQVIKLLSDLAAQSQVKIQSIFPHRAARDLRDLKPAKDASGKPVPQEPVVYKKVLIQVDALSGFHQLGRFISLVETGDKPMQVHSLRISSDPREPKRHLVKLMIESYFATTDDVAPAKGPSS
jgi:Tfp pilus assembly protein PilO